MTDDFFKHSKGIKPTLERRTALISAALTGKIDVRNGQAPSVPESTDTALKS